MLHTLRLPAALLLLLLLFPAAQSARFRLFQHHHPHSRPRGAHHYKPSSPPANELPSEFHHRPAAHPHIHMVTTMNEDAAAATHYQSIEALASILDTPVSGPNHGGNSASLANEKSQNLGDMLPLSGSNNQVLSAPSGPNPGGNKETPAKRSLIGAKSAQISVNSAQLVGGPLELNSLAAKDSIFGMLPRATPVPPSGPSKDHNSATTGRNLFEEEELNGEEGLVKTMMDC